MHKLTTLFFIFLCIQLSAQSLHEDLYTHYETIKEQRINKRRIKHSDIMPLIQKLKMPFRVEQVGRSVEMDINRDALRLQSPESQILKRIRDEMDADGGFNLHDQSRYTAAGVSDNTTSISFLAPAYDYDKNVNEVRYNAMRLIGKMNKVLQKYIPGNVGRYNDDFEPRAFGDNIQKWSTSTILIETGSYKGDLEKQ